MLFVLPTSKLHLIVFLLLEREEDMAESEAEKEHDSLQYTPTWVVAFVCFVFVLSSLVAERGLHRLGKCLKKRGQDALFEALQKLKEELMLLGFISLLLNVSQGLIRHICIPPHLVAHMLPCKRQVNHNQAVHNRRLLSSASGLEHCTSKGKVPLLSLEALHQLHIFIFVLAVVHMIFCAITYVLGRAKIQEWKHWEVSITHPSNHGRREDIMKHHHHVFFKTHAGGYWRRTAVVSWLRSFFKQFYGSVTKSDYIALRRGFIMTHMPQNPNFNFHKYLLRTLQVDFKKVVGISWYLWLFVVVFLLLNIEGWHTYFWLSFLPLILLLLVGAKLEHIIIRLALEVSEKKNSYQEAGSVITPSDDLFWFHRPGIVLKLIHFILFQNSFEIAFFFWVLCTYGFRSCIMEDLAFIITRLVIGAIVQVICSYSTLPLYALVTQMGSKFKKGILPDFIQARIEELAEDAGKKGESSSRTGTNA